MVTRLGSRVRAAGIAEIGGYDRSINMRKIETVLDTVALCSRKRAIMRWHRIGPACVQ